MTARKRFYIGAETRDVDQVPAESASIIVIVSASLRDSQQDQQGGNEKTQNPVSIDSHDFRLLVNEGLFAVRNSSSAKKLTRPSSYDSLCARFIV